ncbi:MAG TPA: acyl-CoA dehydrogenase family protein [Acidobacteriota bacterium]|nr:acyl-CoA dehydrogenase family protein [Acidobacteriota bacterium]
MDFTLTEDQELTRRTIREFAEQEIAPKIRYYDETQEFPFEIMRKLGDLGLMGIIFPPEYGGAGMSYLEYVTIIEELGRVDASVGLGVAAHNGLCSNHIFLFGNEEQKQKYLTQLTSGQKIGMWALTEPNAGSDAKGLRTFAEKKGTRWILNGSKNFITHGTVGEIAVVMAVNDRSNPKDGITAFILEKGMPGFRSSKKEDKLGHRASDTSSLALEDCEVPDENVIGVAGQGYRNCMQILEGGRVSIAALSVGIAQGAFEAAVKYAKERKQFGSVIADYQAIQWMLADMATEIEAARLLTHRAAWLRQNGRRFAKEAFMAKLFASEVAVRAADRCVQIHGGYGYVKDFPAEKFYRDAKLMTIGEGTSEIQRIAIANQLLK